MTLGRIAPLVLMTALLLAVSVSGPDLRAYPISPVTLWGLTEEANLVVLADITRVNKVGEASETRGTSLRDAPSASRMGGGGSIAHLRVREVWKGEAPGEIQVEFDPNYICPAPPVYVAGKAVVAFLTREGDAWTTVALSYGTHYPAPSEIGDYRDRVREAAALQSHSPVDDTSRLDWQVRTAARRATRWDGLYELMPKGDSLHSYYDRGLQERQGIARLTASQYQAIATGFVEQPSADRTLPMVLALFEGRPNHALDRAAMAALETVLLRQEAPWWITEAMAPLLRRLGDPAPEARLAPLGEIFDDKPMATVRAIWTRAKRELGLPDVPAAVPEETPEVWGTGANTPS